MKVGRYRLDEQLGAGGMGQVYRAYDERLERSVALKQILPKRVVDHRSRGRFRREARAIARLSHPNVVKIHDVLSAEDGDWIVMEMVEGETLAKLIRDSPMPVQRVLYLAIEITSALATAHATGIVHRDLKTTNVLVTTEGHAKVLDFGLAKELFSRQGTSISVEGQILGTPHAMSPEQAMGRKVDSRSDLFSLGSLIYEMATGVAPFHDDSPAQALTRVCVLEPPPVHEIIAETPRALSDLVKRLLEKDPAHRPQAAEEVGRLLQELAESPLCGVEDEKAGELAPIMHGSADTLASTSFDREGSLAGRPVGMSRQITVMCCWLRSSDGIFESFDPEEYCDDYADFEALVREQIELFEGYLANAIGRLVVYFGYPSAQEDDARRAVEAALELAAQLERRRFPSRRRLSLQVGIHTGPAVVLPESRQLHGTAGDEHLILGRTLDLTMELQRHCRPGEIVVSTATHRLIGELYSTEALSPLSLSNMTEPLERWRIASAADVSNLWQINRNRTPFVGRERELEILLDSFNQARDQAGQVVLLVGEAGIGKSRLMDALRKHLPKRERLWLNAFSDRRAQNSPFHPILDLLRRFLEIPPGTEDGFRRLEEKLSAYDLSSPAMVSLLATLLDLSIPTQNPPLEWSPQKHRRKSFEALLQLVLRIAEQARPTVLVIEDLHWADPSTLELLGLLIQEIRSAPLLVAATYRPEFSVPWHQPQVTQLSLSRLSGDETASLIDQITAGRSLPAEIYQQLLTKTGGIPLFIEELIKNLLEEGALVEHEDRYEVRESLEEFEIPTTLRATLAARLDRLGTARELAQLASVAGQEFSHALLARISPWGLDTLEPQLRRLTGAGIISRKGFSTKRRYVFEHALIRDAAYISIPKPRRRELHQLVGRALEEHFPRTVEDQPELLALHFEQANLLWDATSYLHTAGLRMMQRSAYVEAIKFLHRGLDQIDSMPNNIRRKHREIELLATLGMIQQAPEGYTSQKVYQTFRRAWNLCQEVDNSPNEFQLLCGLYGYHINRADREATLEVLGHISKAAQRSDDPQAMSISSFYTGVTSHLLGEMDYAQNCFNKAQTLLESLSQTPDERILPHSLVSTINQYRGCCLWYRGYPDQARRIYDDLTDDRLNAFDRAHLLYKRCEMAYLLRENPEVILTLSEEGVILTEEFGFPVIRTWLTCFAGWARLHVGGAHSECLAMIRGGLLDMQALGHSYVQYMALMAEACLVGGRIEEGLATIDKGLVLCRETLDRYYLARLQRLEGELILKGGGHNAEALASESFRASLETARRQGIRAFELQAAISLSLCWQRQGKTDTGYTLLKETCGRFSEGFSTRDFLQVNALLSELSEKLRLQGHHVRSSRDTPASESTKSGP